MKYKKKLELNEKYSSYWPVIMKVSAVLCLLLFLLFMISEDVLVAGYLRFAAFIFFSVAVLSFFKLKEPQITVKLFLNDSDLLIEYYAVGKKLKTEEIDLNSIHSLFIDVVPDKTVYNNVVQSDKTIRYKKSEYGKNEYLLSYKERVLPFTEESAEKIAQFLRNTN